MEHTDKIQTLLFGTIFFPPEILLKIFEYSINRINDETIYEMNRILCNKQLDKIHTLWENRTNVETLFCEILKNNIYDPEHTIHLLSTCKCCKRHQIHRPTKLEIYWESEFFEDWNPQEHTIDKILEKRKECSCMCRHNARWICRVFMPEPDPFIHSV